MPVEQAATTELQVRPARLVEGTARFPQTTVSAQHARMLVRDLLERLGADLLFAFDEEPQREGYLAQAFERFERVDSSHDVSLVVGDSACDDAAVRLNRFERFGVPELDWVDALHVVVLLQQRLPTAGTSPLGIQGGHPPRLERLDAVRISSQTLRQPVAR